jgi:WD40 repeat protein
MASRPRLLPNTTNIPLVLSRKKRSSPFPHAEDAPYVLDVLSFSSNNSYAASGSDGYIRYFDKNTLNKTGEVSLAGTGKSQNRVTHITQTQNNGNNAQEMLVASTSDGAVSIFDPRNQGSEAQIRLKGKEESSTR